VNSVFSLRTIERRLPRLAGRCILVPNGVAGPEAFSPAREHLTGALRVTYVGRLSPRKGPDVALDAVLRLGARGRMVELTLVGSVFPGYEWFEEQLRRQAGDAPAAVRVEFAGFHPDVWELLDRTDVLVVPSRYDEPFGNTAVEGVLARRVVIASDTSGLREAAGGYGTTMFVEPGDPDALADALHSAATSWSSLRGGLEADGLVATERHSPSSYRRAVHSAIAGGR
jgi:glycosyltransferase involved in cell wall biosynthesis